MSKRTYGVSKRYRRVPFSQHREETLPPPGAQFTKALDRLRSEEGMNGLLVRGQRFPVRKPSDLVLLMESSTARRVLETQPGL